MTLRGCSRKGLACCCHHCCYFPSQELPNWKPLERSILIFFNGDPSFFPLYLFLPT